MGPSCNISSSTAAGLSETRESLVNSVRLSNLVNSVRLSQLFHVHFIYLSQLVRGVQCPWFVFTTPEHLSNLKPVAEKRAVVLASNNE